jgi:hypothetical protein
MTDDLARRLFGFRTQCRQKPPRQPDLPQHGLIMAFVIPTFNITVNVWHDGNMPPTLPDLVIPAQLRGYQPIAVAYNAEIVQIGSVVLYVAAGTDLRDGPSSFGSTDLIEAPAGTGRFYKVIDVDDIARGFTNEHRYAVLYKFGSWPTPIP